MNITRDQWYPSAYVVESLEAATGYWFKRYEVPVEYNMLPDTRPWWKRWLHLRVQFITDNYHEAIRAARRHIYHVAHSGLPYGVFRIKERLTSETYHVEEVVWSSGRGWRKDYTFEQIKP